MRCDRAWRAASSTTRADTRARARTTARPQHIHTTHTYTHTDTRGKTEHANRALAFRFRSVAWYGAQDRRATTQCQADIRE
eukprot:1259157-Pyramimonas_sp.AAC.1